MRLKRLVCRGFKSFADRTEFEFDNRLTGIIGPNGCGKSNVVDAIKWVLGDQRAKSLRGNEMTDVIFKGAEGREAMGMAEVIMTFEDPTGRFGERNEVDIGRRLTLDKESAYLLNGQEVRLKDVRDVLLDTGLGTSGYSVMEQGRIDAVLSANPDARRAIFEEAAGVARFKIQKKEALRKLERTDQNLARITDLLEERSRRIRSLRIQAGKARRWQELQAALRDLRSALAVVDGRQLRVVIDEQVARMTELQVLLATAEEQGEAAAARVLEADETIAAAEAALAGHQAAVGELRSELATVTERLRSQQQRASENTAESSRLRDRGRTLAEQQLERQSGLDGAREQLASTEARLIEMHRELEQRRAEVSAAQQQLKALGAQREALRQEMLGLVHERSRARNAAHEQQTRLDNARTRRGRLGERFATLAGESSRLESERASRESEMAELAVTERILTEREQRAMADLGEADAAAAELANEEGAIRRELVEVQGRQQALTAMEAHMEGLDQAPRHVLQSKPEGLRGRLLDLLEIDLAHSAALEAALGHHVQALVVDTRAHADAIVQQLVEARLGRVLLLVEEEFTADHEAPSALPLPEGARMLVDLVRPLESSPVSRRLLGWLLRGVVLVDSIAAADPRRADLCFVTPDGTLLCGPRMEGGAAAEGHSGLVVRRSQIQRLTEQAAAVEARLATLQGGREKATARVERLKLELRQLGDSLGITRRRHSEQSAQVSRCAARLSDLARERGELEAEDGQLGTAMEAATAELDRQNLVLESVSERETECTAREEGLGTAIETAQVSVDELSRMEQDLRLQQAQATTAREGLVRSIRVHEEGLADLERALEELADRVQATELAAQRATEEVAHLSEHMVDLETRIASREGERDAAAAAVEAARQDRNVRQQARQDCERRRLQVGEETNHLRLQMADAEHRFARLEERLVEETGIELRRCLGEVEGIGLVDPESFEGPVPALGTVEELQGPSLPPGRVSEWTELKRLWEDETFDLTEARKEVQVLQSQKDRLGAVNLDAVKELEDEEGQFSTLEQEVADLKEARKALMETLRKLEAESKTLFEQTFAEARKNFQEIFRKLFQGGKADMHLTTIEDSMEAGIEIVAQPPGKQLQSINLLSGGEKSLTAVAILFALFKVRPSPFCILDEVDAALDETNVERFLRVLRDFISGTQFCIVTHHKRTMAECQVLYGITMQRRGVSSRIAVSLQEVDTFKEGGAVGAGAGGADPARKQRIAGEESIGFN
ncbi:MAG: Chromosome partition protein Smc [Planctomycetota bacterium]